MFVNMIVAYSNNNGIGLNNALPWKISSDLKKFKNLTVGNKNNAIIMGKNTWLSLNKSLPMRDNLILTTTLEVDSKDSDNNIAKSFKNEFLLKEFLKNKQYDELWVIGGENIYDLFLNKTNIFNVNKIHITYIDEEFNCDRFFPQLDQEKFSFTSKSMHLPINEGRIIYDIIYTKN